MKIQQINKTTKQIEGFLEVEWAKADEKHHGQRKVWDTEKFRFKVIDGRKIVGYIYFKISAGVCKIENLIIAETHQGQGLGKKLMAEAEKVAKLAKAHKILLSTGKGWPSEKFYQKLGYKKTGDLPNYSFKRDHVVYSKEI